MIETKTYRPDIDGLRAIAVLSVLIYHTFPSILPGGFVGVDIFFVISGYLITSILTKEFLNGSFSYKGFYFRRIKRIYPALLLVVFGSLAFGWFVLLPDEFKQLGKHTIGGMSFLSNIVLLTELGYFDNSSELKPFIHLWSLGVEEQFYIFWPMILSSVFLLKKKRIVPIFILALMSFVLNIYYTNNAPSSAYYLPFTRFWELAIGGLVAFIMQSDKMKAPSKTYLSLAGLILISASFIITNKSSVFPGYIALLPTAGAACIILSSSQGYINRVFLSHRLVVWIGLISYPLYLWHWPIIVFTRIITDELTSTTKLFSLILSVICAWLTYSMLEKNIKNTSKNITYLMISSLILLFIGVGIWNGNIDSRHEKKDNGKVFSALNDWEFPRGLTPFNFEGNTFYTLNNKVKSEEIIFIGDSLIQQYSPLFISRKNIKTITLATEGGCLPIPNTNECDRLLNSSLNFIKTRNIEHIIVGACWDCYFLNNSKATTVSKRKKLLKELGVFLVALSKHAQVKLLLTNPTGDILSPKKLLIGSRFGEYTYKRKVSTFDLSDQQMTLRNELYEIATEANVEIIDPINELCTERTCPYTLIDGTPLYKDKVHMRPFYVRSITYFDKIISSIN